MLTIQSPRPASPSAKRATTLSGETFGMLINLSGRRRFTSQRLVLYAVLASQSHEDALTTARETLALFADAHTALVKGSDTSPGIFCPELEDAYFGRSRSDEQIREFTSLAGRTLDAIESNLRQAPALLQELIGEATPLLATLNRITQVYEELSRRHAQQVKRHLHGIMNDIESIAKQARMVSFNAQIVAARAGTSGKEFSVVASVLSDITSEIDGLVRAALDASV